MEEQRPAFYLFFFDLNKKKPERSLCDFNMRFFFCISISPLNVPSVTLIIT